MIWPPRPSWIEDGSSPMIAPTTLAVAETFSAAKMYGSAAGTRSFQRMRQLPAAYERMSSSARRSAECRPRVCPEGGKDLVQWRHRRVVDDERPAPTLAHPEPAVALPEAPQRSEDEEEERAARDSAAHGDRFGARSFQRDRRHRRMLTTL